MHDHPDPIIVGCGALVRELRVVFDQLGVTASTLRWLPANLHNRPERIPAAVAAALDDLVDSEDHGAATAALRRPVVVAYADCGTGGQLDATLDRYPTAQRLPGAHCYEFFTGANAFGVLSEQELGTFYLTDYLALHFDSLVWSGLGLADHPELRDLYFGNYRRLIWLAQSDDPTIESAARGAAERLGLEFERHVTGLEPVRSSVRATIDAAVQLAIRPERAQP